MVDNPTATTKAPAKPRAGKRRERVVETARTARDTAKAKADEAVKATAKALDENPFGALAGAIAVGAVAAAMIPATRRELEALGPWTEKMREALVEAFDAAKDAGTGELTAAGLTMAAASDGLGGMVGKLVKAATAASSAAATSVKESRNGTPHTAAAPSVPETPAT